MTTPPSPLVLQNARSGMTAERRAIVIEAGVITAVVAPSDAPDTASGSRIVDLEGRSVIPGIDDSHLHAYEFGRALTAIDLTGARSLADLQALLRTELPEATGWLRGHGWESTAIRGSGPEGGVTAKDIDDATGGAPALLGDSTGHAALCSTASLRAAGITASTPNPPGGVIVRDEHGEPTGLLLEAAVAAVASAIPEISRADRIAALRAMQADLLARGIVAVTDPGLGPGGATLMDGTGTLDAVAAYRDLDRAGELAIRTHVMLLFGGLGGTTAQAVAEGLDAFGPPVRAPRGSRLSVDQVKVFADGIPRSRTAWVSEPYDDCSHGSLTIAGHTDEERVAEFAAIVQAAARRGWQVGAHCIGDAAVSSYLDAVIATGTPQLRHYVIHGDLVTSDDLARMGRHQIGMNTNPSIRWTVGNRVNPILGAERNRRKQPLRQALGSGVHLALSSDAPVVDPDWGMILATAMTRALSDDPSYTDGQALSAAEALAGMTSQAAWQSHEDTWRGSIAPGMAADLVVLDDHVDWQDADAVARARATATLIDGQAVFGDLGGHA